MRIATLQFNPKLGDVEGNIKRANELLKNGSVVGGLGSGIRVETLKPDILVLPELAFTGYNFPSLESIRPYLEPTGEGPSAKWARQTAKHLSCKVCVGYPEIERSNINQTDGSNNQQETCYNSLLVVDENGDVILNYRKTFLYYVDETWATEGDAKRGFHELVFRPLDRNSAQTSKVATSFGICMDINPYKFEAPFTAWEFANRVLDSKSQLVILSTAWTTFMSREELDALADKPEMDTFNYWIQRFLPLVKERMRHENEFDSESDDPQSGKQIILVFANRTGEEESEGEKPPVRYAGTSTIIAITQRPQESHDAKGGENTLPFDVKILCWDMMGTTSEGICFADTTADPKMVFGLAKASN